MIKNFLNSTSKHSPACTTIPRPVQSFRNLGIVEKRNSRRRLAASKQTVQTVYFFLSQPQARYPRRQLKIADLKILYSNIQHVLKKKVDMFPQKIRKVNLLQNPDYAQSVPLSKLSMYGMYCDYGFLHTIVFCDECIFHISRFAKTQIIPIWGE